jgi:SAM-dependent methyltransferase
MDTKARTQARFGQYAQEYVRSAEHAQGDDLALLLGLAQPQSNWRVLDIATGGGHTALYFAPHVGQVVACDLTQSMLVAARAHHHQQQAVSNIVYATGDAENLPFAPANFEAVTCRIAPHHFPDCFRFVQEVARVLRPGGAFLLEDNTVPDDPRAARYVDSMERLRDPSHHRCYAPYEWEGMCLDAGLQIDVSQTLSKAHTQLIPWAARQGCSDNVITHLQILLAQAPKAVIPWWNAQAVGTPLAAFDHHYVILRASKPV